MSVAERECDPVKEPRLLNGVTAGTANDVASVER